MGFKWASGCMLLVPWLSQHWLVFCFDAGSASVVEDSFEYLDAPIERISGADVPMPYAANLERLALPSGTQPPTHSSCVAAPALVLLHSISLRIRFGSRFVMR